MSLGTFRIKQGDYMQRKRRWKSVASGVSMLKRDMFNSLVSLGNARMGRWLFRSGMV